MVLRLGEHLSDKVRLRNFRTSGVPRSSSHSESPRFSKSGLRGLGVPGFALAWGLGVGAVARCSLVSPRGVTFGDLLLDRGGFKFLPSRFPFCWPSAGDCLLWVFP